MMKLVGKFYKEKACRIRNEYGVITPEAALIPKPDKKTFTKMAKNYQRRLE